MSPEQAAELIHDIKGVGIALVVISLILLAQLGFSINKK